LLSTYLTGPYQDWTMPIWWNGARADLLRSVTAE
jgi:hypothetical protein